MAEEDWAVKKLKDGVIKRRWLLIIIIITVVVGVIFAAIDIGLGVPVIMKQSESSPTASPTYMCITLFNGISAVVHGGIFFVLLGLPILFYCTCVASAKQLITQSKITQQDQCSAICLPCCNCCLVMFLGIGILVYFGFTIFTLFSVFKCTKMYSIAVGVFIAFILPVNLAAFIGTMVVLITMLIDSCKLCTILSCDYK